MKERNNRRLGQIRKSKSILTNYANGIVSSRQLHIYISFMTNLRFHDERVAHPLSDLELECGKSCRVGRARPFSESSPTERMQSNQEPAHEMRQGRCTSTPVPQLRSIECDGIIRSRFAAKKRRKAGPAAFSRRMQTRPYQMPR